MIGKFKLKKINKSTGQEEVVFEDSNQVTDGFKHAIVNVLTSTGSNDIKDYSFGYFQLGTDNYDLSNYAISGDLTSSSFRPNFWTLKSPMTTSQYGRDSKIPVVSRSTYVLGSVLPSGAGATKVLDNFVEPPGTREVINEYTNALYPQTDGTDLSDPYTLSHLSSIWVNGCQDAYMLDASNSTLNPMPMTLDYDMSGPDFSTPTFSFSFSTRRTFDNKFNGSICIRSNHSYIYKGTVDNEYHNSGEDMTFWTKLKKNQTFSTHLAGKHYTSGSSEVSCTAGTGIIETFNTLAQSLIASDAGMNRLGFTYRYRYDNSAATYTPEMNYVSGGWDFYADSKGDASAVSKFTDSFEVSSKEEYGIISGNIYNRDGGVYLYSDVSSGVPTARNGPGAALWDTSNAGFGPSGNFYRVSITWANAKDSMIDAVYSSGRRPAVGCPLVPYHYPLWNIASGVDSDGDIVYHASAGGFYETTPRAKAWVGFSQYEHRDYASPVQNVHGEQSYYLTYPQKLLKVQDDHTTNLLDNTTNVRLNIDDSLANSQTIKEVGIFLKNPGGYGGQDVPYLAAYKWLPCPLEKNSEFSYIIDWEFSMADDSVEYTTQSDPVSCG
tara:strand:- start:4046 stop:5863 length:1818 start_codon:yes stop_codon:yes gene_type:complete